MQGYGYAVLNILVDVFGVIITKLHGVGLGTWEINLVRSDWHRIACGVRLSALNPQPSTLNPQSSALNPQSSTLNPQP